ncbi:hypothetical protein FA95DRAFT_1682751 [Auriscalpium vulgare]|uniref:Uncharacterized protein n=1 Tax=Auriscalpium vulgare TaxID=40419 RepID=A0ACB8RDC4_9AGAM|nr:hypothetical protein FA95DRAFT_1682751 [Auriscalpium vulgare]
MSSSTRQLGNDADEPQQYGSARRSGGQHHGHGTYDPSANMLSTSDRTAIPPPPPYQHHPASAPPQYPPPTTHQAPQIHRAVTVPVAGRHHQAPGTYAQQQRYHPPMTVPSGKQAVPEVAHPQSQAPRVRMAVGGPKWTTSTSSQHAPTCRISWCKYPSQYDAAERAYTYYCSEEHRLQAVSQYHAVACLTCRRRPQREDGYCGRACRK